MQRSAGPVCRPMLIALLLAATMVVAPHRFAASPAPVPVTPTPQPSAGAHNSKVAVLLYHQIDPGAKGLYSLTPERLRADLSWLLAQGWQALTYEQFCGWLLRGERVGPKAFLLTFDDGYEAMARSALPVLEDLKVPAVIFLETARLGRGTAMTPESAGALTRSGLVSLQCHTHALHYELPEVPGGAMRAAVQVVSEETISADLRQSAAVIAAIAGAAPDAIAWPYGATSTAAIRAASGMFGLQFGTQEGYVKPGGGTVMIPRFGLDWRTHEQVRGLLGGR